MKTSVFLSQVRNCVPLILVEYRKMETDELRRSVPKRGESATMPIIKHSVLVDEKSFELAQFVDDDKKVEDYKQVYNKGDKVIIKVEYMEKTKYGDRIQGEIIGKLEDDAK